MGVLMTKEKNCILRIKATTENDKIYQKRLEMLIFKALMRKYQREIQTKNSD